MATNTAVSEIANRYATALFELADEQSRLDEVAGDLARLVESIDESQDLQRLVGSPVLNREEQGKAMAAILEAMEVGEEKRIATRRAPNAAHRSTPAKSASRRLLRRRRAI